MTIALFCRIQCLWFLFFFSTVSTRLIKTVCRVGFCWKERNREVEEGVCRKRGGGKGKERKGRVFDNLAFKKNLFNWRLITLQYCGGFCHT